MPFGISFFLVIFSLRFLTDYYKENVNVKKYKIAILLFVFTSLLTILLDEVYFLANDDISQSFEIVLKALDEKSKGNLSNELSEDGVLIEDISNYAPWFINILTLVPCLVISSTISTAMLKNSTKKKVNDYI